MIRNEFVMNTPQWPIVGDRLNLRNYYVYWRGPVGSEPSDEEMNKILKMVEGSDTDELEEEKRDLSEVAAVFFYLDKQANEVLYLVRKDRPNFN